LNVHTLILQFVYNANEHISGVKTLPLSKKPSKIITNIFAIIECFLLSETIVSIFDGAASHDESIASSIKGMHYPNNTHKLRYFGNPKIPLNVIFFSLSNFAEKYA